MHMKQTRKHHIGSLFVLVLICVFAVSILAVLLTGAESYRRLTERDRTSYSRRTAAQYLSTKIRQGDVAGMVMTDSFDSAVSEDGIGAQPASGDTLFLEEIIDGTPYYTRIYCCDGYIRELFSSADAELAPEDGEKILEVQSLWFSYEPTGRVTVEITDADGTATRLLLALRSGEGAAS